VATGPIVVIVEVVISEKTVGPKKPGHSTVISVVDQILVMNEGEEIVVVGGASVLGGGGPGPIQG
jgi:hypothetical protein